MALNAALARTSLPILLKIGAAGSTPESSSSEEADSCFLGPPASLWDEPFPFLNARSTVDAHGAAAK